MTFFLKDTTQAPAPRLAPRARASSLAEGIYGAGKAAAIENDANFVLARTRTHVKDDLARRVMQERGLGIAQGIVRRRNDDLRSRGMGDYVRPVPESLDDAYGQFGPELSEQILKEARVLADAAPDEWEGFDFSDDAIETEVNERLKAEHQEARDLVEMMPRGQAAAEFIGGMAGPTLDVKNVPFLMLGGRGGSIWRIMGREALLNMGAEAAFLPSQFEMAERLEIEDPNVFESLATAAAAGAVLGGGVEVAARLGRYLMGRNKVEPAPGYSQTITEAMVDDAEDILTSDAPDAMQKVADIPERYPKEPPFLQENPINPTRPPLIPRPEQRAPEVEAPQPELSPPRDEEVRRQVEELELAADEVEKAGPKSKRPLTAWLKKHGLKIDPDSPAGQELKSMGVTSRSAPGLFKRGGRNDLDNLVADELEADFPGISAAAGVDGQYLSRDGILSVLSREIDGDTTWLQARLEAEQLRSQAREVERGAPDDFLEKRVSSRGLFIDKQGYEPDAPFGVEEAIERDVRTYLDEKYLDELTESHIREIVAEVQKDGGDVDYLVEQISNREKQYAERGDRGPTPGAAGAGPAEGGPAVTGSEPSPAPTGGGAAGEGPLPEDPVQYERTAAGDQSVAPGIAPLSERERLEAAQEARKTGGDAAADFGLFDANSRKQADMFDVGEPAAKERMEAVTESLRAEIGVGKPDVEGARVRAEGPTPPAIPDEMRDEHGDAIPDDAEFYAETDAEFSRLGLTDDQVSEIAVVYEDFLRESGDEGVDDLMKGIENQADAYLQDRLKDLEVDTSGGAVDLVQAKKRRAAISMYGDIFSAARAHTDSAISGMQAFGEMLSYSSLSEKMFSIWSRADKDSVFRRTALMADGDPEGGFEPALGEWAIIERAVRKSLAKVNVKDFHPGAPANAVSAPSPKKASWEKDFTSNDPTYGNLVRGHGRDDRASVYAGEAVPILGDGKYYFISDYGDQAEEAARTYGPKIETSKIPADAKLLHIENMDQWRALTKDAGWDFPNPIGGRQGLADITGDLKDLVTSKGYEGVVVDPTFPDGLFMDLFERPQVIMYQEPRPSGNFEVNIALENGRTLKNASDVLDWLDEGDEFSEIIDLCGRPKGDA